VLLTSITFRRFEGCSHDSRKQSDSAAHGGGEGRFPHAGIAWLAETADLAGLTDGLSTAMVLVPQRRHDPGGTLAQMIIALADGATCLSDLAAG